METRETASVVSACLSAYEWHCLFRELEYLMQICNRDKSNLNALYQKLADQLNCGNEVLIK